MYRSGVTVAGAEQLLGLQGQRRTVARYLQEALDAHPLAEILMSMPGVGVKIAPRLLAEIGDDIKAFPTAAHLPTCPPAHLAS